MPVSRVVVIGASAGGIEALQKVVAGLPADLDAAVLVVLHMAPGSGASLPRILDRAGPLPARQAQDNEPLERATIVVCRADHHLLVGKGHVHVRTGPRENGHRPAVDPLFRSAAFYYGPGAIGVVLSGTLSDGTAGLAAIRRRGGVAVVQTPSDALYGGMPTNALDYAGADHEIPADGIGPLLGTLVGAPAARPEESGRQLAEEVHVMEEPMTETDHAALGTPSQWPCPDCNGVLWQVDDTIVRFRCRVGHAWNATDLLSVQGDAVEVALWTALRAVEDRVSLNSVLAERARTGGRRLTADRFQRDSDEYERSATVLRELLTGSRAAGIV